MTLAATAATSTIAMKTIKIPIPTHIPHIGFSLFFNTCVTGERKQKTYVSLDVIWDGIVHCNGRQKCRYHIL